MNKIFVFVLACLLLNFKLIGLINLPITLPKDQSALEVSIVGNKVVYQLIIEYSLREKINAYANHSFLLPIPSSNDYQQVTITKTNFDIKNIARDKFGNSVLITDNIPINLLNAYLTVECKIIVYPIKYSIPIDYNYRSKINKTLLAVLDKVKIPKTKYIKKNCQTIMDTSIDNEYLRFINAIDNFKDKFKLGNKNSDKIYDKKITSLYPIEKNKYYLGILSFLQNIKKYNIVARMGYGWTFPKAVDNIVGYDAVEFFLPNEGLLPFSNKLEPLTNNGTFINWFYYFPKKENQTNYGYVGIRMADEVVFANSIVWISGESLEENNKQQDSYKNLIKIEKTIVYNSEQFSSFIINDTITDTSDDLNRLVVIERESNTRNYKEKGAKNFIDKVITCKKVEKGKPISPQDKFKNYSIIYGFIRFSNRKNSKIMLYKWITPSGKIFYKKSVEIPAKWSYYYIMLNKSKKKLEKGLWRIEITINKKLDFRKEFLVE